MGLDVGSMFDIFNEETRTRFTGGVDTYAICGGRWRSLTRPKCWARPNTAESIEIPVIAQGTFRVPRN